MTPRFKAGNLIWPNDDIRREAATLGYSPRVYLVIAYHAIDTAVVNGQVAAWYDLLGGEQMCQYSAHALENTHETVMISDT